MYSHMEHVCHIISSRIRAAWFKLATLFLHNVSYFISSCMAHVSHINMLQIGGFLNQTVTRSAEIMECRSLSLCCSDDNGRGRLSCQPFLSENNAKPLRLNASACSPTSDSSIL